MTVTADQVQTAARHLFDAECALHVARQSHVDGWIAAASERLHEAVVAYGDAVGVPRTRAGLGMRRSA